MYLKILAAVLDVLRCGFMLHDIRKQGGVATFRVRQVELVPHGKEIDWILSLNETQNGSGTVKAKMASLDHVVGVTRTVLFLSRLKHVGWLLVGDVTEDSLWVEHLWVDLFRGLVSLANDEDLCGDVTGSRRLVCLDFREELIEDPEEIVVILGAEDLGDVPATWPEDLACESETGEHKLGLDECIPDPIGTDIRGTVIQDNVDHMIEFIPDAVFDDGATFRVFRDVLCHGDDVFDWSDGNKIETHDDRSDRHVFRGHLKPGTRRRTEIDEDMCTVGIRISDV